MTAPQTAVPSAQFYTTPFDRLVTRAAPAMQRFMTNARKLGGVIQREVADIANTTRELWNTKGVPAIEQGARDAVRESGTFAHFLLRTTLVPGRHFKRGTDNPLSRNPWTRRGGNLVHASGIGAIIGIMGLGAAAAPVDNMMQRPADECAVIAGQALSVYETRYADMTRLTGLYVRPTPAVHQAISDACQAKPNKAVAISLAVVDGTMPAVREWSNGYDQHMATYRAAEKIRDADNIRIAEHLATLEREMPMRRLAAQARERQIILAHQPHRAVPPTEDAALTTLTIDSGS